jgi:hypothetical protein
MDQWVPTFRAERQRTVAALGLGGGLNRRNPWVQEFEQALDAYETARTAGYWGRALRLLLEARMYAIAAEEPKLEEWVTDLLVEAIATREAKRR